MASIYHDMTKVRLAHVPSGSVPPGLRSRDDVSPDPAGNRAQRRRARKLGIARITGQAPKVAGRE